VATNDVNVCTYQRILYGCRSHAGWMRGSADVSAYFCASLSLAKYPSMLDVDDQFSLMTRESGRPPSAAISSDYQSRGFVAFVQRARLGGVSDDAKDVW
jgi:hypothetical protein